MIIRDFGSLGELPFEVNNGARLSPLRPFVSHVHWHIGALEPLCSSVTSVVKIFPMVAISLRSIAGRDSASLSPVGRVEKSTSAAEGAKEFADFAEAQEPAHQQVNPAAGRDADNDRNNLFHFSTA